MIRRRQIYLRILQQEMVFCCPALTVTCCAAASSRSFSMQRWSWGHGGDKLVAWRDMALPQALSRVWMNLSFRWFHTVKDVMIHYTAVWAVRFDSDLIQFNNSIWFYWEFTAFIQDLNLFFFFSLHCVCTHLSLKHSWRSVVYIPA